MRGVNEAKKAISPLFPRLNVNDTERGGPRAPPRNKMALYEQLSISSQKQNPGSTSMLPCPQNNGSNLVSSKPSSHAAAYRGTFTAFSNSRVPSHLAEKFPSNSSGGTKLNPVTVDHKRKYMNMTDDQSSNATNANPDLFQTSNLSNFKKFSFKNPGNEDGDRVPRSPQGLLHCNGSRRSKEWKKLSDLSLGSTLQSKGPCENQMKGASSTVPNSRQIVRSEISPSASQSTDDHVKRSAWVLFARDNNSKDVSSSPSTKVSLNEENGCSMDALKKVDGTNGQPRKEFMALHNTVNLRDNLLEEPARGMSREISSKARLESESRSNPLLRDDTRSPDQLENGNKAHAENNSGTLRGRPDDVLETTMLDAISDSNIFPDDVVGAIGEKQFWKARRTITNQQRIFAVQVFELHRLLKVQRLIAGSPHLMLDDNLYLHKPATKASPVRWTPLEYVLKPPARTVKPKDTPVKSNPITECVDENINMKFPLPPINNSNTGKGSATKQSNYGPHLQNLPPAPTTVNESVSWPFLPAPGNQWLVPIMSPSEGLVYKPYAGPCPPPAAGFMAPNFRNGGPLSLNPGSSDYLNATYGGPACNQQGIGILPGAPPLPPTYFPPYGLPMMNPIVGNEQTSPFGGDCSNEQENQSSYEEINFTKPHQSSCNSSSQMSRVLSCRGDAYQASRGSELPRSTASSPSEGTKGDALPLFPVVPTPTVEEPDRHTQTSKLPSGVIKVVPHNPRSATESAARIFWSIQEEKKHL
ncbi:hypothetical protein UlMin_011827 [Ulmus minor]